MGIRHEQTDPRARGGAGGSRRRGGLEAARGLEAAPPHLIVPSPATWGKVVRLIPPLVATPDEIDSTVGTQTQARAAACA